MHHAYLYEGPASQFQALAESAKAFFNIKGEGNADLHVRQWEKFNIDEARELSSEASFKTISGGGLFIIGISSITTDAQQALLKLFEEPQEGLIFVVQVPHGALIPTLRSRFIAYPEAIEAQAEKGDAAAKFLASAYKERSLQITALLKDDEGEKERAREFIAGLESLIYAAEKKSPSKELRAGLADIALTRNYLSDRSASIKMLMEHLAAVLPNISANTQEKSVRSGPLGQV